MTRPGPKPGPPGSQRTARLVVRVTPAELSAYQAAAGRAGVSMGEWVRTELVGALDVDCAACRGSGEGGGGAPCRVCLGRGFMTAAAEKEHGG